MRRQKLLTYICLGMCLIHPVRSISAEENTVLPQDDENFVKTELVISSPGKAFYSTVGHASLRMQCPTYGLDYCFSPEIARPMEEVIGCLSGTARMGLVVMETEEYLNACRIEQRKVTTYPLNLTLEQKRELWRLLDNKVADGLYMTYDYLNQSCALETASLVNTALGREKIVYGEQPEWLRGSRREIICRGLQSYPWVRLSMMLLMGTEADKAVSPERKLIIPADIASVWEKSVIQSPDGSERSLVCGAPAVLYDPGEHIVRPSSFPGPMWIFGMVFLWGVILTLVQIVKPGRWNKAGQVTDGIFFGVQTLAGLVMCYLWLCSDLVATDWNKYNAILNPLPLLVWLAGRIWRFSSETWWKIYTVYGMILCGFVMACIWLPCPDYPLWFFFGVMAIRCFYRLYDIKKEKRNTC